jgi:hypothetical protein
MIKERIIEIFEESRSSYGYRRIHAELGREGKRISEKIVRVFMSENALTVYGKNKRKYSSYQGEKAPSAENIN